MTYSIVFGNCAGAARGERCNPYQLGKYLKKEIISDPVTFGDVVAVGLSEVIISSTGSQARPQKCTWPEPQPLQTVDTLDHLNDFFRGYESIGDDPAEAETIYLSHLNSKDHNHSDAVAGKWNGPNSARRIVRQFQAGNDIHQGTGALLFRPSESQLGVQLRPSGLKPKFFALADYPLDYRGNRDSEPRSAIVVRGFKICDELVVDLAFCQLETHSSDKRVAAENDLNDSKGSDYRINQLDKLCRELNDLGESNRPLILMGDFNTRFRQKELTHLTEKYGFKHILPQSTADYDGLDLGKSEEAMGLPFSHLKWRILIDHAFVRGLDDAKWQCSTKIIPLADEEPERRITDHRPVVLTIKAVNDRE